MRTGNKSSYQIEWAIIKVEGKGTITAKDKKMLDKIQFYSGRKGEKEIAIHAPFRSKLSAAKGKLSKKMKVLVITDKQFGRMRDVFKKGFWKAAMEVATAKQKSAIFTIE